jgi:hypothetical protein
MKIQLPQSHNPLIRLNISAPGGEFQMTLSNEHAEADVNLPEYMPEEAEVEVLAMYLDAGNKPVGEVIVLKEAVEPEPEPEPEPEEDDEDDPVEADEEVAQSPPDEEVDEEADEEELEDMDVDEDEDEDEEW